MRAEEFRNTIGPMLPVDILEMVMAQIEQRDRLIARLSTEHDANLEALQHSAFALGEMQAQVDHLTRGWEGVNKLVAGLTQIMAPSKVLAN